MKEVHGAAARHQGWALGLWLSVAILAHILVALFGVLNRWLQVNRGRQRADAEAACIPGLRGGGGAAAWSGGGVRPYFFQ